MATTSLTTAHAAPALVGSPSSWANEHWDVVVAGAGNAALVSAMAANDAGARVLVLERAPKHMRGGNTRHVRNIRCAHEVNDFTTGRYSTDELYRDLCNVGEGVNDEQLARFTVDASTTAMDWMTAHGIRWQQSLAGTLHLGRTNQFFLGGGKALLNSYYREIARRPTITVAYAAKVIELEMDGTRCAAVVVEVGGATYRVRLSVLICASGGFEANLDWLRRYWGSAVDNYIIRGTPYNDGHVLERLYANGAASAGKEQGFHAIAVDARSPRFDGGIATRLDTIPYGIVVNKDAQRFADEGEDVWPKRYATWGTHIARQPDQIAYSLWDAKVARLFLPAMYGVTSAPTIREVATRLGLDAERISRMVEEFNACAADGPFDPATLDGLRTEGLAPDKTNWAQRLDTPPFFGIAMRPGITFTYMGVRVDSSARIALAEGGVFDNIYAAGEIMSGNILSTGYLAGFGMTIGTVWGRHAGTHGAANLTDGR